MENVRSIIERKRNEKDSNKTLIVQKLSKRITLQKRYRHLKLTNAQAFFSPLNVPNFLSHSLSLSIEQNYHSDCIAVSNFPSASDLNSTFSSSRIQIVFHSMLTLAIALLCALSLVKLEFSPFSGNKLLPPLLPCPYRFILSLQKKFGVSITMDKRKKRDEHERDCQDERMRGAHTQHEKDMNN